MVENKSKFAEHDEKYADFAAMLDEFPTMAISQDEIRKGTVNAVRKDFVLVEAGGKSDGIIHASEFTPEELANLKPGDKIDVVVVGWTDDKGNIALSKEKAAAIKIWEVVERAYETDLFSISSFFSLYSFSVFSYFSFQVFSYFWLLSWNLTLRSSLLSAHFAFVTAIWSSSFSFSLTRRSF